MQFGLCVPHYGRCVSLDELRATVKRAEALGFHSVWVSDHVVTPSRLLASVGPTFYDPLVALTCAAAFSERVRLGSSVIVVPYRNPLVVAKMLATLDVLSGGRVIFGVGAGGAPDEFQALGVPSHQRGRRTDEYLLLMVALWTEDPTSFRGRFFSFTDVRFPTEAVAEAAPVPIWVGGRSEAALRRAVAVGEAWHPTSIPFPMLQEKMLHLKHLSQEAGRSDGPMVTVHQGIRFDYGPAAGEERRLGQGTPEQIHEDMHRYEELGVPIVVCNFSANNADDLRRAIDTFATEVSMAYLPEPD